MSLNDPTKPRRTFADALPFLGLVIIGTVAFSGQWESYDLIRMLIARRTEAASLASFVGLVGSITTLAGTALGFVGGALFGGRKPPSSPLNDDGTVGPDKKPLQTEEQTTQNSSEGNNP